MPNHSILNVHDPSDYYPFGLMMSGRSWSEGYRYGFNGKEQDAESMGGNGSTYDYGFRIYNPAIAKFLSVDPLTASYPWYTPYQFAGNKPIIAIDLDGLEEFYATDGKLIGIGDPNDKRMYLVLTPGTQNEIRNNSVDQRKVAMNDKWDIVPVPSSNVLSTYDQAFGLTDKNENGGISNEHGFAVGITEDGILVSSAMKTDENPRAVTLAEAISELEAKGIEVLYVVHTHGNNYTEIDGQISAPEHFPSVGPTDDTGNQGRRLDNGLVVHSSVVLGWETTKYETTIQVNNGILTEDRVVSEVKQRKMITWYSRDEADQFDMDYVEYRKVLQKIFKKHEKQNKE